MGFSTLVTLATFLPLLFQFGITSPIPVDTNHQLAVYPDPAPCYGNISWIHDPSIIYEDGTYWRFSTSGNIAVATAPSIKGPWTYQGPLLPEGTKIKVAPNQDIWAPSISKFANTYYTHYSVSTMGSQSSQIGLATADSLFGPWTDHGSLNLPQHPSYNLIDPSIFQASPTDPLYFTFGSYWSGIQQFSLPSPDRLMALDGSLARHKDIRTLVTNSTARAAVVEGAVMHEHEGLYFLFFSVGACCNTPPNLAPLGDEYRIAVCRADAVTGPFFDQEGRDCRKSGGTTVLASHGDVYAPGGQGIMRLPGIDGEEGRDVMYYHYVNNRYPPIMPRQVAPPPSDEFHITLSKPFSGTPTQQIEVIGDYHGPASIRRTNKSDNGTSDEKKGDVPADDVKELLALISALRGFPSSATTDIYGANVKVAFTTMEMQWSNGDADSAGDVVSEIAGEQVDEFKRVAESIEALARTFARGDSAV
ncbi:hypothetical protein OPT61_g6221 [Boeremia exigua]|uniref:Uncharacterized protein n=1 Tax=Boeremia exigua TaxID=749465 RepID=A0ACC2I7F1_9PLEO|nr:hypothetical protein OPT61_g6221 [Boeremia exigua]